MISQIILSYKIQYNPIDGFNIAEVIILYVNILFVKENHRRKNLGSILLQKVEAEAKSIGASLVHLDTFDFQAKGFYIKHGYEIFEILDDCPTGHQRFYLKKKLL